MIRRERRCRPTRGLAVALLSALLAACGGGSGGGGTTAGAIVPPVPAPPAIDDCGVEGQKRFVLDVATDWYRWYRELAPVDAADYASADAYLAALTAPLAEDFRDPGFSYLTTAAADNANLGSGTYVGFGFRFTDDDADRYRISDVYETGSAFAAGFERGAALLAVDTGNGFRSLADLAAQGADSEAIFGPPEVGVVRGFRLQRVDGTVIEVEIAKTELDVPPLARAPRLLERSGLPPVGYLHLRAFTRSAITPLTDSVAALRAAGTMDIVIDLRFNGGGSLVVAEHLLDLLGGGSAAGDLAYQLRHNDLRRDEDYRYRFRRLPQSLAPNRIVFITTETTASASELVINSLAPWFDVVLVGTDTRGKAVGQYAFDQPGCANRLRLVAFDNLDANGQGEYFTGLVDTGRFTLCRAEETAAGAFGDAREPLLAAALDWLDRATCPSLAALAQPRGRALPRRDAANPSRYLPGPRSPRVQ